jgi:hypothetical protein
MPLTVMLIAIIVVPAYGTSVEVSDNQWRSLASCHAPKSRIPYTTLAKGQKDHVAVKEE